ncbi:MAG: type II secretion system protein [Armatimonadota bacterium]
MGARWVRGRRAFALVEILLVVAIIGLLVGGYYGLRRGGGDEGTGTSIPARSIEKAKSVECAANLNQLRQLIQMHVIENGAYPSRFNPGEQGSIGRCPVSGQPYVYNAQTGEVHCTTPGHESL